MAASLVTVALFVSNVLPFGSPVTAPSFEFLPIAESEEAEEPEIVFDRALAEEASAEERFIEQPEVYIPPVPFEGSLPEENVFSSVSFFVAENAQAYADFSAENPNLDIETVVWKVNAFLHLPFYSHIVTNYDPNPLLVNPSHRLPAGFAPAELVSVYSGNPDLLATPETAAAFASLRAAANNAGLDLAVVSAYRSAERQQVLFDRQSGDGVVARPYQSEHQTGRALDLWGPGPSGLLDAEGGPLSAVGLWVAENAHYHGFIVRYTEENTHITGFIPEPWHITYVGRAISESMTRQGILSLEEYVARNPGVQITN